MTLRPAHSRAARGLLDWRQHDLAAAARVGLSAVRDLETGRREVADQSMAKIRAAIEAAGVELLNGSRIGVRFKQGIAEPDPRTAFSRRQRSASSTPPRKRQ